MHSALRHCVVLNTVLIVHWDQYVEENNRVINSTKNHDIGKNKIPANNTCCKAIVELLNTFALVFLNRRLLMHKFGLLNLKK